MTVASFRPLLSAVALSIAVSGFMVAAPLDAWAQQKAKSCSAPASVEQVMSTLQHLATQRHSLQALVCAAEIGAAAARAHPDNVALNVEALHAHVTLLEHIDANLDESLYVAPADYAAAERQWGQTAKQGQIIGDRLRKAAAADPDIATLVIAHQLEAANKFTNQLVMLKTATQGVSDLEAVIKKKPDALHGIAQYMLGRLRLFLPVYVGGDAAKAITHFQAARAIDGGNIENLRWLAEALVGERDNAQAVEVLNTMLPLTPAPAQLQQFGDHLRGAIGLSARLKEAALQAALTQKRQQLLKDHPEILPRTASAASGHGGVDPLTGKAVD